MLENGGITGGKTGRPLWQASYGMQRQETRLVPLPSLAALSSLFSPRHYFLKHSCRQGNGTEWAVTNESLPLILAKSEHPTLTPDLAALAS